MENLFNLSLLEPKINIDLIVQVFLLVVLALYSGYSLLLYKQLLILNKTIQTPRGSVLNMFGFANLTTAVLVFIFTIILRLI